MNQIAMDFTPAPRRFNGSDYDHERKCTHPGCERKFHANGYCLMHCSRNYRGTDMDRPHRSSISLADRFWAKVTKSPGDGCWEWDAADDGRGYGHINVGGRIEKAYRVAYQLEHGHIPKGCDICHECDNPKCVRPSHLFAASHHANMLDSKMKGRLNPGQKNGMAKLTNAQAIEIAERCVAGPFCAKEIARKYGVHPSCIKDLVKMRRWASITRHILGGHTIDKEHIGNGLYLYRLVPRAAS